MRALAIVVSVTFVVIVMAACTDQVSEPVRSDSVEGAPEVPSNIEVFVSDGEVELSWEVTNPGSIRRYFVYRRDSTVAEPEIIDSTAATHYVDYSAKNGTRFLYQIAAQGTNGLIGKPSVPVLAASGLYSVTIDNGRKYATSINVTVSSAVPPGTRYMMLTNDTLSSTSQWFAYSADRSWQMESGDGVKMVYAKFRDFDGNETRGYYHDDIILDTRALIDSVTENSNGQILTAGDELHISLYAGEAGGQAAAEIPQIGPVQLFDDGASGDAVADDGVYEADLLIPTAVDLTNELITGQFLDAAGNEAAAKTSRTAITIANSPKPVELSAFVISESEIELVWTRSRISDFSSYLLFRDETSSVDTNDVLLTNETNAGSTRFTDRDLQPGTVYHYVVYTQDQSALRTASNTVAVTTDENESPTAVELFVSDKSESSISLGWTKNDDPDFSSYNIYRSGSSGVQRSAANLKGVVTSQNSTSYTDDDVEASTTYYYVVVVYDKYGAFSALSNEVQVTSEASAN